jgi:hypothetical protein
LESSEYGLYSVDEAALLLEGELGWDCSNEVMTPEFYGCLMEGKVPSGRIYDTFLGIQ